MAMPPPAYHYQAYHKCRATLQNGSRASFRRKKRPVGGGLPKQQARKMRQEELEGGGGQALEGWGGRGGPGGVGGMQGTAVRHWGGCVWYVLLSGTFLPLSICLAWSFHQRPISPIQIVDIFLLALFLVFPRAQQADS